MISVEIDLNKIDESLVREVTKQNGPACRFIKLMCWPNADGTKGVYGDDGYVKQGLSKEQRDAGIKTPICGNFKYMERPQNVFPRELKERLKPQEKPIEDDDIPF